MKNYRQLIKGLPSKTVIMTVGSFNPPTSVNEMAFKLVDKLVESHNADHIIYVTEDKDNLPIDRKLHFLELMFGAMNFKPLNESNLTSELIRLKSRYKDVIVVASEDKAKLYESMQVVTTSNDLDHSKIKSHVTKGDFVAFKKAMPTTLRELDARRLMNEMRQVTGLELLKEEVKFSVDALREKYFTGKIYHIGDIVESAGQQYEIMDRGSNYLVVVNSTGDLSRKWIKDVSLVEACWTGYKQVGTKKKGSRTVPNCVPESVLNPTDPHKDYTEKSKTLQDLSRNKDVDQKAVQQRRLDLDKEYRKLNEQHTQIEHSGDHKVIRHGHDFSFKIHKDHHEKIKGLGHKETYEFKCMDGIEWAAHKNGDKLYFKGHPGDTGIDGNLTIHVPHSEFMGEDEKEVNYKGYTSKNLHQDLNMVKSFKLAAMNATDPVAMLNAIKTTDAYMDLHNKIGDNPTIDQVKTWKDAHIKTKESLQKIGIFDAHAEKFKAAEDVIRKLDDPHNNELARTVLSYQDYMKAGKISEPENSEKYVGEPHTTPGHTLATRHHLRRQKISYVHEAASVTDGEVEGQVVTKVKPLPVELAPAPDEPGKQRGKGNSAFFEKKNKKVEKEALDYLDLDSWLRQQSQQAKG